MEDESLFQETTGVSEETDEEEEIIGNKRPKGRKQMIIEDDDEGDDYSESNKEDGDNGESYKKKGITEDFQSLEKEPAKDMANDEKQLVSETENNDIRKQGSYSQGLISTQKDDSADDKGDENDEDDDGGPLQLQFNDKSVFDAESSDEDQSIPKQKHHGEEETGTENAEDSENASGNDDKEEIQESSNDEGFDEDQLDPEILKKLKKLKGASKSTKEREKYSRKAKPTADKMLEIYSESQRLRRDSRVNLPYYEPEEKSLDDFLARVSKKRQEYSSLKRATDFQKAQIIHEKLSVTPPLLTPPRKLSKQAVPSQVLSSEEQCSSQPCSLTDPSALHDSGLVTTSQDLQASQSSTVVLQSRMDKDHCSGPLSTCLNDQDELPDPRHETSKVFAASAPSMNISSPAPIDTTGDGPRDKAEFSSAKFFESTEDLSLGQNQKGSLSVADWVPTLQKDPSRDLFSSQGTVGKNNELPDGQSLETEPQFCQSSFACVVSETPLSTQSTQCSTQSLISSSNVDGSQTDVTLKCITATETLVSASDNTKCSDPPKDVSQNADTSAVGQSGPEVSTTNTTEEMCSHSVLAVKQSEVSLATKSQKRSILDKLQSQGVSLPSPPKLRGTSRDVICLDEDQDNKKATSTNPGLLNLISRLASHNQKKMPKPAYDVDISIVQKEGVQGQEELKLKSVKYHIQPEENLLPSDGSPGSKLSKLKQQLSVGMKKKREEQRQRRIDLYNLENEEGFKRTEEEEEEEVEMTDAEDEDSEEDDEELGLDDYGAGSEDDGEDYDPFLDKEAKDSDEDGEKEEEASDFNEDSNDFHLNFEVSDENDGSENDDKEEDGRELTSLKKKKRRSATVLSDDEDDDNDEAEHKATIDEDHADSESLWSNDMTPLSRHLQDTQPQGQTKATRASSCSPDLYATATALEEEEVESDLNYHNESSYSQGIDNLQSQMLDADGYLKLTQTQKPPKSRIAMLAESPTDGTGDFGSSLSIGQIFGGQASQANPGSKDEDDENMGELIGLCSGKFKPKANDEDSLPSSQTRLKHTQSFEANAVSDDEDDEESNNPFKILSQDENAQDFQSFKHKSVFSDSEEEENKENKEENNEADTDSEFDEEEAEDVLKLKDKKKIKRKFLEEEAELSGSEFDSDENLDLAEEDDILEEEEGDRDLAGISESKLRNQVGRLHMKQLQDDDDREINRYKEMYLQDGDLYSDGHGRKRNFRWKDIDNNSQQDMFNNDSEDEQVEEDPQETQWRKDRFERDKFLEEAENKGGNEDSQLVKLGQGFLQKKDSFSLSSQEALAPPKEKAAKSEQKKFQLPMKGSFLSRSKDALVKIAKMAKGALGGNRKNTKGFVFQAADEKETQEKELPPVDPLQPPKRKAHTPSQPQQAAKKQKLSNGAPTALEKPTVKRKNSIIHLLD